MLSARVAIATRSLAVATSWASASPSGSLKYRDTSIRTVSRANSSWSGIVPTATGARLGTSTTKLCWAVRPPGSLAVTVTVVLPGDTPVTRALLPEIDIVATLAFADSAVWVSASPSGSLKYRDTSIRTVSPAKSSWSGIAPTATGARLGTSTTKLCWAVRPPGSLAVTVTVVLPGDTPVTRALLPEIDIVATLAFADSAVWVSASPSGSLKYRDTSIRTVSPAKSSWSGIAPTATGARLGTLTVKTCCAVRPSGSLAVTVTVVLPWDTPVTNALLPEIDTVATLALVVCAV